MKRMSEKELREFLLPVDAMSGNGHEWDKHFLAKDALAYRRALKRILAVKCTETEARFKSDMEIQMQTIARRALGGTP